MIREALTSLARTPAVAAALVRTPVARDVVSRVVGGESLDEVVPVAQDLADRGFHVALERVAPGLESVAEVDEAVAGYTSLINAVKAEGWSGLAEVAILPESLGQELPGVDAADHLDAIADRAAAAGVALQLGTGPLGEVEETLGWARALLDRDRPVGVTMPAVLRATERRIPEWSAHRVRLVKGAHAAGVTAFRQPIEIDKAYVRCAKALLQGTGEPSFATHDPRLITIIESLARRYDRPRHSYEFAFYLGRQTAEQERLLAEGERVRIYIPYGPRWLERLVGGLPEQPGGVSGALRSLLPG